MSKHEKALAKLLCDPPPADLTWDELVGILTRFGYEKVSNGRTGGSRRKFYNRGKDALIHCHEPHPRPYVDRNAIRDVVEHLKINGIIKDQGES